MTPWDLGKIRNFAEISGDISPKDNRLEVHVQIPGGETAGKTAGLDYQKIQIYNNPCKTTLDEKAPFKNSRVKNPALSVSPVVLEQLTPVEFLRRSPAHYYQLKFFKRAYIDFR